MYKRRLYLNKRIKLKVTDLINVITCVILSNKSIKSTILSGIYDSIFFNEIVVRGLVIGVAKE